MFPATPTLTMLGVSFRHAPIAVRESLSYTVDEARSLLRASAIAGLHEAVVLSTCNRTEFYLVGSPDADIERAWVSHVRTRRPQASIGDAACELSVERGEAAVRHLFRVACGLDSAILGDAHIARQLKQALSTASAAGTLGRFLERAFQDAFATAKTVRATTDLGRGHASLGSAVAGLVTERRGTTARVVLIGAGVAARDIARQLTKWDVRGLVVVNRTASSADALAAHVGAATAAWESLDAAVAEADVVVAATSAATLIDEPRLRRLAAMRPLGRLLVVDAGVPRNVAPCEVVEYVGVDDISGRRDDARTRREAAIPHVEFLVDEAVARWRQWVASRPGEGLLRRLFIDERRCRTALVDQIVQAGFAGTRDDLDRTIRRAWGAALEAHARGLRSWWSATPDDDSTFDLLAASRAARSEHS